MKKLLLSALCFFAVAAKAAVPAPPASAAETAAGTDRYKYVTPYGLANAGILGGGGGGTATTNNATLLSGFLLGGNGARGATNVAVGTGLSLSGGVLTAPGGGLAVGDLSVSNYIPRVLVSDATPQDPYRWMNLTNGLLRFPSWSSDRIVGSLTPGIHFHSVTNGVDQFSIDVQQNHGAGGLSEARMIALWDMAIVPGYNSRIQLGASTDNYNQNIEVQYANRMGWSHLLNLVGNTNGNIGSFSLQNRRISTSTNLNELHLFARQPTWNTYPTPGFSDPGVEVGKLAIAASTIYSPLYVHGVLWATNRLLVGTGPNFYTTSGGIEQSSGFSDGFMVGADFASDTRTTGSSKYFWMTQTPKTHSDAAATILCGVNDGAATATLNIGGGTSAKAPFASVKIWAGADSTATGTGSLGLNVTSGLVTTTNLVASQITGNGIGLTNMLGWNTNIAAANSLSNNLNITLGGNVAFTGTLIAGSLQSTLGGSATIWDHTSFAGASAGQELFDAFAIAGNKVFGIQSQPNDVQQPTNIFFRVDYPTKQKYGLGSFATNYIANANTAGYTNSRVAPGIGGTNNMVARVVGTSGTLEFYNRSGEYGATICGVGVFTNTISSSTWHIPIPVNSGFIIRSGSGVDIQVYAQ